MDELTKQLAAEYDLAKLRQECQDFKRQADREKYRDITNRYAKLVRKQENAFLHDYSKRLRQAARRIAEERGLNFDKTIKTKDAFSKRQTKALKKLATGDVHNHHLRSVAAIRAREAHELDVLRDTVRLREARENAPQQAPNLLTGGRDDAQRLTHRVKP